MLQPTLCLRYKLGCFLQDGRQITRLLADVHSTRVVAYRACSISSS